MRLRPARWWDRWFVLRLRNRADVIGQSSHPRSAGVGWWRVVRPMLWLIVVGERRAGYLIVDSQRHVSIVLHPTYRGRGIGTRALARAKSIHRGIHARVKSDNVASRRAFTKAGFEEIGAEAILAKDGIRDSVVLFRAPR